MGTVHKEREKKEGGEGGRMLIPPMAFLPCFQGRTSSGLEPSSLGFIIIDEKHSIMSVFS